MFQKHYFPDDMGHIRRVLGQTFKSEEKSAD